MDFNLQFCLNRDFSLGVCFQKCSRALRRSSDLSDFLDFDFLATGILEIH